VYAALSAAWVALSDVIVFTSATGAEAQALWSMGKGLGFVAVTALLIHGGLRWALCREREEHDRVMASQAVLRAVTDAIPDPVFLKDRQSRWLFGNPAAFAVVGRPAGEVLGRTDREIYDDRAVGNALVETDRRIMESGAAEVVEENIQTPAGYRVFLSTKVPLCDGRGRVVGIIGNARDITERKRAEEALQQAQKLEGIGRLAGGVAHDFNNLLTVILAGTEALRRDMEEGAPSDPELISEIDGAARRARDLTRQLLAFARRQVIAPVPVDLNAFMRSGEKLWRRVVGEGIELGTALQPDLWSVRCDPGQLEQVVLNLVLNARDAMPEGGRLTMETRNVEVDEGMAATHPFMRPGPYVRLSVRDSGQGMTPEVRSHAFEPFFTTKPVGQGTGLGLATVYGVVKQSDGYVLLDSAPGQGTTFELFFPRSTQEQPPKPP
jgi:PAS domain S-box-containing protein